ncbi:MAG: HNH endonuclease [Paludibacteraceae bacterium]|nr:HNH endonuclease [Paludibacteraceae bacterium]
MNRTIHDKNEIIQHEDYAEIVLYDIKKNEKARTLIDLEDIDKISDYKWSTRPDGYVIAHVNGKTTRLHRFLMGESNLKVDHINRNRLDNRKSNLRFVTDTQNAQNRKSGLSVWYKSSRDRWVSTINVNKKRVWIGSFKNKEEAQKAKIEATNKYFGDYSPLEF